MLIFNRILAFISAPFLAYFNWLQKDNPTGEVEQFPDIAEDGETSVKGIYIIGDLTGIPLLKFATNSGKNIIKKYVTVSDKMKARKLITTIQSTLHKDHKSEVNTYDIVIIGGGPAGVAAAIEAQKQKLSYILLEASERPFNTIEDFPVGKKMFYEPIEMQETSDLTLSGKTKEELLSHFKKIYEQYDLNIQFNSKVDSIESLEARKNKINIQNSEPVYGMRTILAIGKTGNHRMLKIEGEKLPHVFYKLYDPYDYANKKILVVGGGDSALETALLLVKSGNKVTLSYRKKELIRAKPANINKVQQLLNEGKIKLLLSSELQEINAKTVSIKVKNVVETHEFDNVFVKIGNEPPYEFFAKSGIKLAHVKTKMTYWWIAFSLSFANIIYFGKLSTSLNTNSNTLLTFFSIFDGDMKTVIVKLVAWLSIIILFVTGIVIIKDLLSNWNYYFKNKWSYIKYSFFFFTIILFLIVFFGNKYFDFNLGNRDPYFWYSFLYTVTIGLFGLRRIIVTKQKYVTIQTITLFLIQAIPLFLIPNFILPWMNSESLLSPWIIENVFLGGEWWRFVGFILAWPLFIWNIFTDQPSMFWLIVSLVQTFVIIPIIVIKWGKGAYCSWICSCGAMAETLGDEYRTFAWHGPKAKKVENIAQIILLSIILITFLHILGWYPTFSNALQGINNLLLGGYQIIVDTILAGTIGIGLYFFYGGRVWCRFFCPLAALMNIYNKFSHWHILSDKKKCISCGLCTKSCHMGIDVMAYAQQGKPLDDTQCVNCSACINVCPTGVLSFGKYNKLWKK